MRKRLFLTLVVALAFRLIMTLVPVCEAEQPGTTGSITREVWTGISGDFVRAFP